MRMRKTMWFNNCLNSNSRKQEIRNRNNWKRLRRKIVMMKMKMVRKLYQVPTTLQSMLISKSQVMLRSFLNISRDISLKKWTLKLK